MSWLLPMTLVLLAGIVFAAGHFAFVRWMARMSEPATVTEESDAEPGRRSEPMG
jgi:hypothetical protein